MKPLEIIFRAVIMLSIIIIIMTMAMMMIIMRMINGDKTYLCRETTEESKPEVTKCKSEIFIKEVAEEFAHSQVRPPAVDKEQSFKVTELGKRKVAG